MGNLPKFLPRHTYINTYYIWYDIQYIYNFIYVYAIIYNIVWYVYIKPHSDPGTSFWPWPFRSFLGPDPCPELLAVKEFRSWCPKKLKMMFFGDERNYGTSYLDEAILMFTKVWLGSRPPETCLNDCIQGTSSPTGDACLWRRDGTRPGREPRDVRSSGPRNSVIRWFGDLMSFVMADCYRFQKSFMLAPD